MRQLYFRQGQRAPQIAEFNFEQLRVMQQKNMVPRRTAMTDHKDQKKMAKAQPYNQLKLQQTGFFLRVRYDVGLRHSFGLTYAAQTLLLRHSF
ncbi:MAG: hypothetical protein EZS28_046941 [Streblomastix strix]|uniref:Uncharacterized protein n=1 Tax=Streblomastix strix TaxID=222440 RepID=A0A5J4TI40_9EUKA|nr:MAG: hypothetical protein EZS28_046941 [Streblomastix strix]